MPTDDTSDLKITDPELIEIFDTFAFDEVLRYDELDARTRLMVQLAATIACQGLTQYRMLLGAALAVGVTPIEAKEIVYQAVPYLGMAKVIDFLRATNDVLTSRGVELPLPGQSAMTRDDREAVGLELQKTIVGEDGVDKMRDSAPADAFRFQTFLADNCFGDYVSRSGLPLPVRELLTFSMLVSLGGCEPQAKSHASANLRIGNDRGVLIGVITQLLPFIGYPRTLNALAIINELAPAR